MLRNFLRGVVQAWTGDNLDQIDIPSLKSSNEGKVAIVTGGTAGMGKVTVFNLAKAGYTVTFTGRNEEAGKAIVEEGKDAGFEFTFKRVDYTDLSTIREFVTEFASQHANGLDLLVNNAAVSRGVHQFTKDGFESVFQTNTLGPYYMTKLLLPLLKAAPNARIVYVCSDAHWTEKLDFDDLNGMKYRKSRTEEEKADNTLPVSMGYWDGFELYSNSKMLNILAARKLLRNLQEEGSKLPVYLLHPGEVSTSLTREDAIPGVRHLMKLFFHSVEFGARTQTYLSLAPMENLQPGAYYVGCEVGNCLPRCDDLQLQDQAWEKIEEILQPFPGIVVKSKNSGD